MPDASGVELSASVLLRWFRRSPRRVRLQPEVPVLRLHLAGADPSAAVDGHSPLASSDLLAAGNLGRNCGRGKVD